MLNTKAKLSNKFNWLRLSRNIHPYSWCSFLKCNKYYDDPVTGAGLFTSMVGRWQSSSWLQCLLVANLTLLTVTAATTLWEQWDTSCPSLKNLETKCIWSSTTFVTICRVPYLRASFSGIEKVLCIWVRVRVGDRVQIRDQVRVHVWFQPGVKSGSVLRPWPWLESRTKLRMGSGLLQWKHCATASVLVQTRVQAPNWSPDLCLGLYLHHAVPLRGT